jgi:hypothetical protein
MTAKTRRRSDMTAKTRRSRPGFLVLLLVALPLLDGFGVVLATSGPNSSLVLALGVCGFALGAALGASVSSGTAAGPWWSSWRWVICGLIGLGASTILVASLFRSW